MLLYVLRADRSRHLSSEVARKQLGVDKEQGLQSQMQADISDLHLAQRLDFFPYVFYIDI